MSSFTVIALATIVLALAAFFAPVSNTSLGIEIGIAFKLWKEAGNWLVQNGCDDKMTLECMVLTGAQYGHIMIGTMGATQAWFLNQGVTNN